MQSQRDHSLNEQQADHPSQTCRGAVAIAAEIRVRGEQKSRVNIVEISQTGFRMECLTFISDHQVIFLTLPSFQPMEARIVWQNEWMYGCEFARPLYFAVYEHIVRTHPALQVEPPVPTTGMMYGAAASLQWGQPFRELH